MQLELVIDGARFSDYDGFVREFNRAYLAASAGPPWDGGVDDLHELLDAAAEVTGERVALRWLNSQKSRCDLGHEQMAETCLRQMANIPKEAFSPAGYELVRGWDLERLKQARAGKGRTLFEWLVWQMTGDGDEFVDLKLE